MHCFFSLLLLLLLQPELQIRLSVKVELLSCFRSVHREGPIRDLLSLTGFLEALNTPDQHPDSSSALSPGRCSALSSWRHVGFLITLLTSGTSSSIAVDHHAIANSFSISIYSVKIRTLLLFSPVEMASPKVLQHFLKKKCWWWLS